MPAFLERRKAKNHGHHMLSNIGFVGIGMIVGETLMLGFLPMLARHVHTVQN
jgi:hypothetical protein